MMRRKTYESQSVFAWALPGETYEQAKKRLDELWAQGKHPVQLIAERKRKREEERY